MGGRDVNDSAGYVKAGKDLAVGAGRDINVKAGQASASVHDEHYTQSNGILSSKSTYTIDESAHTQALGSTFSGDTVTMSAGRDLTIAGSTVAATYDVNLSAKRDLAITTTETTSSAYSFKEEKKSGFGATGSGLSYGNRDQKDTINDRGTQQVGSLVGSTDGSVHISAGNTLTVKGSDLVAKQDITGVGADVNIEAAQNRQHHDETHEVKSSGFTLGVQSPVLSAAQNVYNQAEAAGDAKDGRAAALRGIAAARGVVDLGKSMADITDVAVSLSWGTSQSKDTLTQDSTTHNGSQVKAGGTAAFVATGVDANGNKTAGNLNIVGSDIDAKKVVLQAKNDVNIVSATDTDESHSTNKSSSASVGVSYGTKGFGVSASGSMAKGNSDSQSTTQANSHINGKESVAFVSGNDTNILGATVNGGKVMADVGGNLNIASRQDTGETHAKQESMSAGVSISQGGGSANFSASKGKADGTYANVTEQSGIYAGDGGFDINVKGNTDLKGAVIASDATKDKNSLTTGTLTYSDLQNHSDYSANSFGLSAGIGYGKPTDKKTTGPTSGNNSGGINPMIPQHESGSQDGVASAAVADGTIKITDGANQKQDLAGLKRDTSGTNSQVGNNPDLKGVLDKQADMMAAAQAAGEAIAKSIGEVANAKLDAAKQRASDAQRAYDADPSDANKAALAAAVDDVKAWAEGGQYRVGMHVAGGAMVAGLGGGSALAGAAGAGVSAGLAPQLNGISNAAMGITGDPDVDRALGNTLANIVAGGLGAAVGGGSGAATAANADLYNRSSTCQSKGDCDTSGGIASWIADQVASAGRGAANLGQKLVQDAKNFVPDLARTSPPGQQPPSNPDPLTDLTNGGTGTPPTAGGAAVAAPILAPCGNTLCQVGVVVPGKPGSLPANALLSSGNGQYDDSANDSSILDAKANKHILDGDGPTSGGHRFGTGTPGKSEFPQSWSDQKIANVVSDIATDPSVQWSKPDARGYASATVTREGVDVKVIYDTKSNRVVTGYPTNLLKNQKP